MTANKIPSLEDAYDKARKFLIEQLQIENGNSILDHYLSVPDQSQSAVSLEKLYFRMLASAQNANMKAGVIGGSIVSVRPHHISFDLNVCDHDCIDYKGVHHDAYHR